jgi:hypothetical protein
MESPMTDKWVLTWARTAFITIGSKNDPLFREHLAFDSQNEAVDFAMSLDDPQRRTVQLHLPCGDIAELQVIERMHATQK